MSANFRFVVEFIFYDFSCGKEYLRLPVVLTCDRSDELVYLEFGIVCIGTRAVVLGFGVRLDCQHFMMCSQDFKNYNLRVIARAGVVDA